MNGPDPWAILGLAPGSSRAAARLARRTLAKQFHPDVYRGDSAAARAELSARMTMVNRALADIERQWEKALVAGTDAAPSGHPSPGPDPGPAWSRRHRGQDHDEVAGSANGVHAPAEALDAESFAIAALPVEAFESLFLVSYGLGDILVADEPYLLELYLNEPAPCFCRLTLVPEAGGSIVTVEVSPPAEAEAPATEAVRDILISELNRLAIR